MVSRLSSLLISWLESGPTLAQKPSLFSSVYGSKSSGAIFPTNHSSHYWESYFGNLLWWRDNGPCPFPKMGDIVTRIWAIMLGLACRPLPSGPVTATTISVSLTTTPPALLKKLLGYCGDLGGGSHQQHNNLVCPFPHYVVGKCCGAPPILRTTPALTKKMFQYQHTWWLSGWGW